MSEASGAPSAGETDAARLALAASVRDVCRRELARAWEDALSSGLCGEGAFEAALGELSRLTPEQLLPRDEADGDERG